jgi:hypothetical protein
LLAALEFAKAFDFAKQIRIANQFEKRRIVDAKGRYTVSCL